MSCFIASAEGEEGVLAVAYPKSTGGERGRHICTAGSLHVLEGPGHSQGRRSGRCCNGHPLYSGLDTTLEDAGLTSYAKANSVWGALVFSATYEDSQVPAFRLVKESEHGCRSVL